MSQPVNARPIVVHLEPNDLRRGAQIYARAIRDYLDGPEAHHLVMTMFGPNDGLGSDIPLNVPRPPGHKPAFDAHAAIALRQALRKVQPAVVIAHGGEPLKYVALTAPRSTKLIYVKIITSRPQLAPGRSQARRALLYRLLLQRFDFVAGVSREMLDEAHELFSVPRARLAYVPNARDPDAFDVATHHDHSPVRLCFVGHLGRVKRPERFVQLVGSLRGGGADVVGVIAGSGPYADSLIAPARESGVDLLGERDDIPRVLKTADCFVFTSTAQEGMPGVLIEAGMAGLPTVTTDVPGARDVVEHGVTGFVVPVDDFVALKQATLRLVGSVELRNEMGNAARERCTRLFSFDESAKAFDRLLASVMDTRQDAI